MNEVESYISDLSKDDLKHVILNLADKQNATYRIPFNHDYSK